MFHFREYQLKIVMFSGISKKTKLFYTSFKFCLIDKQNDSIFHVLKIGALITSRVYKELQKSNLEPFKNFENEITTIFLFDDHSDRQKEASVVT